MGKLLGHICSMGKVFKIFELQPYLAGHVTSTEKKAKTQTADHLSLLIDQNLILLVC